MDKAELIWLVNEVENIRARARARNEEGATVAEALDILEDLDLIIAGERDAVEDWYEEH